jgi:peptidyl-prolyl cis-trans isomerase SDCCAG10
VSPIPFFVIPCNSRSIGTRRHRHASDARKAQIEEMQAKIRKLDKRRADSDSDDSDEDAPRKKRTGPSFLDQELAKYSAGRRGKRGGKKDEDDVMSALSKFTGKLKSGGVEEPINAEETSRGAEDDEPKRLDDDTGGLEVDDDVGFMKHMLRAMKDDNAEQTRRAESDYTVCLFAISLPIPFKNSDKSRSITYR